MGKYQRRWSTTFLIMKLGILHSCTKSKIHKKMVVEVNKIDVDMNSMFFTVKLKKRKMFHNNQGLAFKVKLNYRKRVFLMGISNKLRFSIVI